MKRILITQLVAIALVFSALIIISPISEAAPSGAPCSVGGYTYHAELQMSQRDISKRQVEDAVRLSCANNWVSAQANGTFKYQTAYVVVVLNRNAWVVTVWTHSPGGGSGGGIWQTPIESVTVWNDQGATLVMLVEHD